MGRAFGHLFAVCWVGCRVFCILAIALLISEGARYGHLLSLKPDGLSPWIAQDVPYRWPVEAWETQPVLGFKRGVYWIGGMRAGHGTS